MVVCKMRYKEYNRNRILGKCIKLFWSQGFCATSISQIVETTRVNRFSLYAEFNNKEGILYAAINLYLERIANKNLQILTDRATNSNSLKTFFDAFLEKDGDYPGGCFLVYVSTELGKRDAKVTKILDTYLSALNHAFLQWAKYRGFKKDKVIANQLVGLYCSTMCYGIILSKKELEEYLTKNLNVILKGQ